MDQVKPETIAMSKRALLGALAGAILIGFVAGRAAIGGGARAAATDPDATATRTAELDELHRLQTQVAQTVVCSPPPSPTPTEVPTETPTPTPVPPVAMGQSLPYVDGWTVVING